jgi:hypothetical protein
MRGDRKNPLDAFLVLTKASFGDRRRSPIGAVLTVLLIILLLAGLIYLLWPGPERPPLLLAAFDQVALPGEPVSLCARLEPLNEAAIGAKLGGCRLYFQDLQSDWHEAFATDRDGKVVVERNFAATDIPVQIVARYPGDGQRQPGVQATSRVFVWPPETSLLLVDADETLPDGDPAKLWKENNLDIRPRSGAAASLRAARAKYRIGYLSAGADQPSRYNKLRAWLERGWTPEPEQFPDGPLLAPAGCLPLHGVEFVHATVQHLRQCFPGAAVAVTAEKETARFLHQAGWQTFLLTEAGEAPEGVTVIKSWSELNQRLP